MGADNSSRLGPRLRSNYMSCSCALDVLSCDYARTRSVARTTKTPKQKNKKDFIGANKKIGGPTERPDSYFEKCRCRRSPAAGSPRVSATAKKTRRENEKRGDKTRASYIQRKWASSEKKTSTRPKK